MKNKLTCLAFVFALGCEDPKPPPGREKNPPAPEIAAARPGLPPGHPPVDMGDPKELLKQVDALGEELKKRPKTFEVQTALANLYYDNGRYLESIDSYREALEMPEAKANPREASTLRARRGNSFYLIGNALEAMAEHRKALLLDPKNGESLFFLGAIVMESAAGDKKKIEEGKALWKKLLAVAPDHPRAELVKQTLPRADQMFAKAEPRGAGEMPAGHPPIGGAGSPNQVSRPEGPGLAPIAPGMMEAIDNTPKSPEMQKGLLAKLAEGEAALDAGKPDDALIAFRGVMPMTGQYPELGPRAAAGMGAALRALKKPMAERVLDQAVKMDPNNGRALYELGALYAESGRKDQAVTLWTRLLETDPKYAAKVGAKEKLAALK